MYPKLSFFVHFLKTFQLGDGRRKWETKYGNADSFQKHTIYVPVGLYGDTPPPPKESVQIKDIHTLTS